MLLRPAAAPSLVSASSRTAAGLGGVASIGLVAAFALLACTGPVRNDTPEAPTEPANNLPALQDTAPPPSNDAPVSRLDADGLVIVADDERAFIGILAANEQRSDSVPADYCVDGTLYEGATLRVGRLNVFGAELDPTLLERNVVVIGTRKRGLWSKLQAAGPCPADGPDEFQARSDWMAAEGGYRNDRATLEAASYLEAVALVGPEIVTQGESTVTVRNPFADRDLLGLQMALHFETNKAKRKPMPSYESYPVGLAPGERYEVQLPKASGELSLVEVILYGNGGFVEGLGSPHYEGPDE